MLWTKPNPKVAQIRNDILPSRRFQRANEFVHFVAVGHASKDLLCVVERQQIRADHTFQIQSKDMFMSDTTLH